MVLACDLNMATETEGVKECDMLVGRLKYERPGKWFLEVPGTSLWIIATHYMPVTELLNLSKQ